MIYYLLYPLSEHHAALSFLNVLRYVPFRVLAATMTAMLLTFGLYPWFIRRLQSKQIGQVVRDDGPKSHLSKAGTPTMGGSLILLALIVSTVLWADPGNSLVWVVTAITAAYGFIGYIDDAAKIRKKNTGGLAGRYKLLLQFAIAIGIGRHRRHAVGEDRQRAAGDGRGRACRLGHGARVIEAGGDETAFVAGLRHGVRRRRGRLRQRRPRARSRARRRQPWPSAGRPAPGGGDRRGFRPARGRAGPDGHDRLGELAVRLASTP